MPGAAAAVVAGDPAAALAWFEAHPTAALKWPALSFLRARLLSDTGRRAEAEPMLERLAGEPYYAMFVAGQRLIGAMERGLSPAAALATTPLGTAARHRGAIAAALAEFDLRRAPSPARHIAICGVAFCGSTLLDILLEGLPGVASIGESDWLTRGLSEAGVFVPVNPSRPRAHATAPCNQCGRDCAVVTPAFRTAMALDPGGWYFRIAERLGSAIVVSADKNLAKIIVKDPLLRLKALVAFRSPASAWSSTYARRPPDEPPGEAFEAMVSYFVQWRSAYGEMLHDFAPRDGKHFLDFEAFCADPAGAFPALAGRLGLSWDAAALERLAPGHSIGGNPGTRTPIRRAGGRLKVRRPSPPALPPAQAAWIAAQSDLAELHAALKAASTA